jgi:hypothetical protein
VPEAEDSEDIVSEIGGDFSASDPSSENERSEKDEIEKQEGSVAEKRIVPAKPRVAEKAPSLKELSVDRCRP